MELKDLYRDVILDHNRLPRNFGRLEPADATADGHNPLCGDRLTVSLRLSGDTISDIRFEGKGCAISTASASLMSEAVKGRDRAALGKLAALSGVREFPARVKCASLCWHTLNAALEQGGTISTEDGSESSAAGAR
jgi:nitrogen fixation protein NifU and related proteins